MSTINGTAHWFLRPHSDWVFLQDQTNLIVQLSSLLEFSQDLATSRWCQESANSGNQELLP